MANLFKAASLLGLAGAGVGLLIDDGGVNDEEGGTEVGGAGGEPSGGGVGGGEEVGGVKTGDGVGARGVTAVGGGAAGVLVGAGPGA